MYNLTMYNGSIIIQAQYIYYIYCACMIMLVPHAYGHPFYYFSICLDWSYFYNYVRHVHQSIVL